MEFLKNAVNKIIRFFSQEYIFVLFFSFLLLVLSFSPTIYEAFQSDKLGDPRRLMLWGEHNYTYDYNVYLAKMRQGAEGRWTVINKYTSEPHRGSLLQEFYLLSGKFGSWLGLSPAIAYHFLRIILGFGFVLAIWGLICYFLNDPIQRKIAFLIALFSGSLPRFLFYENAWHPGVYMDWWQEMEVIKRATYVPHYLAGHILTILALLFLLKSFQLDDIRWPLAAGLTGFVGGFIHPPSVIIVGMIGAGLLLTEKRYTLKYLVIFTLFCLAVAVPLFYIQKITQIYPWKSLVDYDKNYPLPFQFKEYILALGANFFLGILGAGWAIAKKDRQLISLVFWVGATFLAILVFQKVRFQSEVRFVQVAVHLPLAVLSVGVLNKTAVWFKKKFRLTILNWLVVFILALSLPGIYASVKGQFQFINQRVAAVLPLVPYPSQVMYPLKDWWEGIKWLEKNTSRDSVVLSKITAGNYIPAYAGNTVYFGHQSETPKFMEKRALVDKFFSGQMGENEAREFLRQKRISYVFFGPQEQESGKFTPFFFLKPVFQKNFVTIYKFEL